MSDAKIDKSEKQHFVGAPGAEPSPQVIFPELRQSVKIKTFIPNKWFRQKTIKLKDKRRKPLNTIQILGAAGPQLIPEMKLKEVTDPLIEGVRDDLTKILLQDPIAAPAARYSIGAVFEDGFDLQFTVASKYDTKLKRQLTPEEVQAKIDATEEFHFMILEQLATWKDDLDVEQLAKDLHGVSLAQGKACGMMLPGVFDLQPKQLPKICEIVPADDLGNPIIDVGETRKIVAVKLDLNDEDDKEQLKDILRADEMCYYVTGIRGLRREAKYHGIPPLEPVLQISKALKRAYHLDAPLAMVAAYITKQLIKVSKENVDEALQTRVSNFMSKLFKADTWAMAMPDWYDGVDTVTPKVDWQMFDGVEDKLAVAELTALGVPKSAVNREQSLNRDIATIQAIQFVRFIRKPAEEAIKKVLENQIFNPLYAHLAGVPLAQLPLRVEIVRRKPEGGDIDAVFDQNSQDKNDDMNSGNLRQSESSTTEVTTLPSNSQPPIKL